MEPVSGRPMARALLEVQDAIAQSGLVDVLAPFGMYAAAARPAADALLQCHAIVFARQGRFSEADHIVVRALDLENAFSSTWWASLITAVARASVPPAIAQEVSELCTRLRLLTHNLDRLTPLLERGTDRGAAAGDSLLMRLPNHHGAPPALRQVAAAIEAVDLLATVVAALLGGDETIQLAGVDAAGQLEFRASGPMIRSMQSLVTSIGEHIGAYEGARPAERAAAIATLLPITGQIGARHDAARLRGLVKIGVAQLLASGWTGAGLQAHAVQRPADAAPIDAALPADLASLIAEERRQLLIRAGKPRRLWQQPDPPPHFETPTFRPFLDGRAD